MVHTDSISVSTRGRSTIEITESVNACLQKFGITIGLANVFIHHTSASLILCENADRTVREDLERFMSRLAPDGDPSYRHRDEGADDMPAHLRSILTCSSISIPVRSGQLDLGTWQGLFLYEHRTAPHRRKVSLTVVS